MLNRGHVNWENPILNQAYKFDGVEKLNLIEAADVSTRFYTKV